jgi:hypothetical protein
MVLAGRDQDDVLVDPIVELKLLFDGETRQQGQGGDEGGGQFANGRADFKHGRLWNGTGFALFPEN